MTPDFYIFSFTALALRLNDTIKFYQQWNLHEVKQSLPGDLPVSNVRTATWKRQHQEYLRRINALTKNQQSLLLSPDYDTARQVAFLAVCKAYGFIRDFTVEVLRDKVQVFDYQLTENDILSFISRKSLNHPELENSSDTTRKKAVQVMLRILEEAGMIDSVKSLRILPQLVSREVMTAITEENPEWLKIFLYADRDIQNLPQTL
jgi:ribosomal protein S8